MHVGFVQRVSAEIHPAFVVDAINRIYFDFSAVNKRT